ncbi:MAG: segregation/condensation protein A [Clostridia bacterium]|nr:segregation/condensation protein A [Clostridia bacterium]
MTEETLTYRLDDFEGPLDLLLALIDKNKVDIANIPIASICEQYMQYLEEAKQMDLEIACEFIVMASTLMFIKSKMLLPRDPEKDEDPRRELVDALLIYQKAKQDAEILRPLYAEYSGRFAKDNDEIPAEKGFPLGIDPHLLSRALTVMVNRLKQTTEVPVSMIHPLIKRRVVSVEDQIKGIVDKLTANETASFFFLLKDAEDRSELLATFMGILELIKMRRILFCEEEDAPFSITSQFKLNPDFEPDSLPETDNWDGPNDIMKNGDDHDDTGRKA